MSRILFMMTGSIAAYKAAHVLSRLKQSGHEIEVVATPSALQFIGEATIEGLTGRPVRSALFGAGVHMAHIDLIRWADLAIVCPATANTINKLASGAADDLLTTLFLAHDFKKPWLIAPAMNVAMYRHPLTQASLSKLQTLGCTVLNTGDGALACGESGEGRLLEPEVILSKIETTLRECSSKMESSSHSDHSEKRKLRVLVTSGGTSEPIDAVRAITNTSTGHTGALIVDRLLEEGHSVHFLTAKNGERPFAISPDLTIDTFVTFQELATKLEAALGASHIDTVVHAAAVADYSLVTPATQKIDSENEITLTLKKNPKLIDSIRPWAKNKGIRIVAFKLTAGEDRNAKLRTLAAHAAPHWILANDIQTLPAWDLFSHENQFTAPIANGQNREGLARTLETVISEGMML
ncbi:MAG: bifunctional phosphopantothenoylcysteine decarboxylase/phosphopantothenate--cysteine ligase CoaBC [Bdellovibrionales bacterium]|nr:bifunctional phosphopantothenoylcysteine decarboxylase/phosphopantothenate--cysteine ligase CoaBC [Bdellovibrionales bacterium]